MRIHRKFLLAAWISAGTLMAGDPAWAQTMKEALALAYTNNPSINAQRAGTRAADEAVAIAKSGYRPTIAGSAYQGKSWTETRSPLGKTTTRLTPGGFGVEISQSLFDGFRTQNNVRAAKSAVMASRETLRNVEQNILFDAASVYMDVLRDRAVADYRRQSLAFLEEQVRSESSRFEVGESTRTDVAQARGRRAAAQAQLAGAQAQLKTSIAIFMQVIGREPKDLRSPKPVTELIPSSMNTALEVARSNHPAIKATKHLVDQALFNVKTAEGELLPTLSLNGSVSRDLDVGVNTDRDSANVTARLSVPIYQGGRVSATVRQNKEVLGQRRIEVDEAVDNVRAAVVSAYSQLEAARASVIANQTQLEAANLALQGAIEERKVGQRTTLDVLNTQQEVIDAQIALAQARRDLVVASYAALSAVGKLDVPTLKLAVARYEPDDHYQAVKDKWYGLRTPDGQ
ncbi:MAG: TolC family outer membrane protein [Nitratireductor sp.]|nr:TolC family outer membrane protein [Nitratireductor sp.]